MKTFERAFAIDSLEEFVVKIIKNRKELSFEPAQD
jgi:hypothetical protein